MPELLINQQDHAQRRQLWLVGLCVVLAHAGVIGFISSSMRNTPTLPKPASIIMASVIVQAAEPAVPATPQTIKQPSATPPMPTAPTAAQHLEQPLPVQTENQPTTAAPSHTQTTGVPPTNSATPTAATAPVVLPSSDAAYINNPAPAYPRQSRRIGEEGTVVLRVFINTEGQADKLEIRTSSGYARLDEAALSTVQRWRFVPGKRAGVPEAMWFNVPISFVLD